jgi:hypothetical protein
MNKHLLLLFSAALCLCWLQTTCASAMSGRDVYEKVHELRQKTLDRRVEAGLILYDKGGTTRTRSLIEYSKKADPEAYKVLVVFQTPPDLKDVGFLIHARTFSDRDLWAYLPEFKRIRRIPATSQDDAFFGTDFSYDDFGGPPNLDDYAFSIAGEEDIDGKPCYKVEVIPKIQRKYTRFVAWVAKDLWIHLKIAYYQEKTLYRAGSFSEVRMVDDIPTAFKIHMENMTTGHKTTLTIENISYRTRFQDDLFSQHSLERAGK